MLIQELIQSFMMRRIERSIDGMLYSLYVQIELLKEYYHKAFFEKNSHYLGEIAGKLRILVIDEGRNKALLLRLMEKLNDPITIKLATPPNNPYSPKSNLRKENEISVQDFLNLDASTIMKSGSEEKITKKHLIKKWSQQLGSAHQDWTIEEDLRNLFDQSIIILGIPLAGFELKETAKAILHVSEEFLSKHSKDLGEINSINEKWHPIVKITGLGKTDEGIYKTYFFWIENKDLLKNNDKSTIIWFKEDDDSIFRLIKDKNRFIFEQSEPKNLKRQCGIKFTEIKQQSNYFIRLYWNSHGLKLTIGYEDGSWTESN